MSILFWVLLGGFAGWIASQVTESSTGAVEDVILGIMGGFFGGLLLHSIGVAGVTGFNLYSLLVAVLGVVLVISLGRLTHFE